MPILFEAFSHFCCMRLCPSCYNEWADQARLYINHYGLQMADPDDRKKLNQAMKEFFNLAPAG